MLKNAPLIVKIGVDTDENEPRKGSKKCVLMYALKDPDGDAGRSLEVASALWFSWFSGSHWPLRAKKVYCGN